MNLVEKQYDLFPYPHYPVLARPRQLGFLHLTDATGRSIAGLPQVTNPRILLLGSGTFEPLVFATSHPQAAEILAVDLSRKSLKRAKIHCWTKGAFNVRFLHSSLEEVTGQFDFINCYGVLHHLPDPQRGFRKIHSLLSPQGQARIMVYSSVSRRRIRLIRQSLLVLGIDFKTPHAPKLIRRFIETLPKTHPLRASFALYRDSQSPSGMIDGFLHVEEHTYEFKEIKSILDHEGLQVFHWQNPLTESEGPIPYLEASDELGGNFVFWACRQDAPRNDWNGKIKTHPLIQRRAQFGLLPREVYSQSLRKNISIGPEERESLKKAAVQTIEFDSSNLVHRELLQAHLLLRSE